MSEAPAPVLIVPAASVDAATQAARGRYRYTVQTLPDPFPARPNGLLEPLRGVQADIWPDATEASREWAAKVAGALFPLASRVRIVDTADAAEGFSVAQAAAEGIAADDLWAWAKARIKPVTPPETAPEQPKPPAKQPAGSATTDSGLPAYVMWEKLGLARNERGPYATEANALLILSAHTEYSGRIWLDEFSQRLMIDDATGARLFSRTDAIQCLVWMQQALQLPKMALSAVERAAVLVGERNKRHPLRAYLQALQWDGIERLPTLLSNAWGADQTGYTAAVGRCWLVAMVARALKPGCKADYVPVFEGAQGTTKSTALSIIGGEWFLETTKNPVKNPDAFLQSLQGKWLVEIPEIDRIGGKHGDLSDLTGLITITTDTYRMPYAPTSMDYPRQCIIAGTANRSANWQPDETGGRRYWPVVTREIDLDYLRESRDQLFAEAMVRYQRGEPWWDVPADEAREQQEQRRVVDEWETIIERYMTHYPDRRDWQAGVLWYERNAALQYVTVSDVLQDALGLPENRWDMNAQKRVAKALTAIGLTKQRPTIGGKRTWVYAKSNTFPAGGSEK